jgi:flagellar biosynthetic protein FliO
VAAYKKKFVTFLIVVALGTAVLVVCSGSSTPSEQQEQKFDNLFLTFENDSNVATQPDDIPTTSELFFKMMLSVLLIVVLGAGVIYVSKKFGARISNLPGKKIHVIETVSLGPRKAVHLLKIGNQGLLIGSTTESITKLADVTDVLSEMDSRTTKTDDNLRI